MTSITPIERIERHAQAQTQARIQEAHERAREAAAKAKTMLRLTVQMAVSAVNDELDHVPDAQAVAKAAILPADAESTIQTIEQYIDDLLFQPMQLLSKESDEQ
jgi:vacuolar-type H+-ATPase subunit H